MVFNYLGQPFFSPAPESRGPVQSPRTARRHLLDWTALVAGGRLRLTCRYSDRLHSRTTVERLVEATAIALRELIEHCRAPEAGGFTPSDFAAARVDQKQLDRFLARIGGK
jgi:non-ribosomal peptide synthase protein (TIGR01720 family)